ncbi:GvpL/GvpF family gas vesicle protein [Nonomuraea turkmeniaca]|uniref:GvpL/GvpF family gas vesicle protein n=1 Tax=Nonomuraea turkmeniaca TaxID=103838 RepID=A0A5S4FTA2_9ACTN|nr:GvpL/GvpF family gas vesicle protein [Nonomuraea turkmeniaca]TMR23863.1 GvpL/GvpF family gas vesicle protein [Nonomuraea turkmeniaca]
MSDVGTYLYAVALAEDPAPSEGLTGVTGGPVRAISHAGLVAYVSAVPLTEFGEEPLRRSLEDMDWLGETARAHHRVVEAVAAKAPTAPVRLVTVYRDDAQIRSLLEQRHDDFVDVLSRIAGRQEWGVKVYAAPSEAPQPEEPAAPSSPGTAYLKKRQASLHTREEAWRQAVARAEQIHDVLGSVAVASHRHRAQDPQLSGREEWMVLNGAYLVDEERGGEFGQVVEGLRGEGIEVELTGPWAPYSFTTAVETGESEARDDGP